MAWPLTTPRAAGLSLRQQLQLRLATRQPACLPIAANPVCIPYDNIDGYSDGPLQTDCRLPINECVIALIGQSYVAMGRRGQHQSFFRLQELFNPNEIFRVTFTNRLTVRLTRRPTAFPPTTATRITGCSRRWAWIPRRSRTRSISITPMRGYFNTMAWSPTCRLPGRGNQFHSVDAAAIFHHRRRPDAARLFAGMAGGKSRRTYVATFNMPPTSARGQFHEHACLWPHEIPVLVSNQFVYTPAVQRVLQLAANIYDATTNNHFCMGANFPSVFRPTFLVTNDPASGYHQCLYQRLRTGPVCRQIASVTDPMILNSRCRWTSRFVTAVSSAQWFLRSYTNVNVYGVPWIIGAKKGFPNFNEFAMESVFQLTRKIAGHAPEHQCSRRPAHYQYNQMFNLSLSNQFGVECWNSYTNTTQQLCPLGGHLREGSSKACAADQ